MGTPEGDFTARVRRLMKLRASTPVLQTGRFEVLEADRQTIVMRRYLTESGEDAFGRQVLGPNEAVVRVTRTKQGATGSIEIKRRDRLLLSDLSAEDIIQTRIFFSLAKRGSPFSCF